MVSTASNDIFRNKLPLICVRAMVVLVTIPVIVLAIKSPSVLQIYLISNIFATAALPSVLLGLSSRFKFMNGFDVICSGLGGMLSVFVFGVIYYGDPYKGAQLLILSGGLYADDWSVFGTATEQLIPSFI
jgi:hypothetical protein